MSSTLNELEPKPIVFDSEEFRELMAKIELIYKHPLVQGSNFLLTEVGGTIDHLVDIIGRNYQRAAVREPMKEEGPKYVGPPKPVYKKPTQSEVDKFFREYKEKVAAGDKDAELPMSVFGITTPEQHDRVYGRY